MSKIELAEQRVKVEMINEIIKVSSRFQNKSELESKIFSELKYIYYNCRKSVLV
jgi:hypothetical protein